jgi:predicted glycosyltransferase
MASIIHPEYQTHTLTVYVNTHGYETAKKHFVDLNQALRYFDELIMKAKEDFRSCRVIIENSTAGYILREEVVPTPDILYQLNDFNRVYGNRR